MTHPRRILWLALFVATALFVPLRASAQNGTVTDDGFLSANGTTQKNNLGGYGSEIVVAGSSATVGTSLVGQTKGFIKFQLQSSLPPGSPALTASDIAKATLKLFISPSCNPTGSFAIYAVTSNWSETALNPSAPPTLASTPFATGIAVGKPDSFVVVDVTGLVKQWVEGSTNGGIDNDGIALVAETATTNVSFDSKDNAVTSHEPRLEIVLTNSGPPGTAATVQVGSTTTLSPNGQASVTNSGTSNAAILNFAIPQGQTGATGQTGAPGQAATVAIGTVMPVPYNAPPVVMNGGTANAAVLNFMIPQGQPGATGAQGPQGPQGPVGINNKGAWSSTASYNATDAVFDSASYWLATTANTNSEPSLTNSNWQLVAGGIVNRGAWSASSSYNVNDAVSDAGSYWLALRATSASSASPNTSCEPSQAACAADWQLLAAQGTQGAQGQTGAQGPQGIPGPMGIQGPPGVVPLNIAVTNANNNFSTPQTVGGNVSITGAGNGVVFPDGTVQTTAAAAGGNACTPPFEVSSSSPVVPVGYTPLGQITAGNVWVTVAPMPTARGGLAAAKVNGKIYAVGGFGSSDILGVVEVYDPSTSSWSTAASMPTVRGGLSAAAVNGKIYAIGGLNGVVGSVVYLNTVEMYDPSSNTWSAAAPMPTARNGVAVVAVNGKIYALGGSNASIGSTNIVEVYDPSANTWNAAAPMPTARTGLAAATLNGKIYAIGGSGRVGGSSVFLSTVEVYDPSTDTWSVAAPMPTARNRLALAAVHGKIYAIGGAAGVVGNAVSVSTVEVYDPSTDTWTAAASMPAALDDLAASDANDLIYTLGGFANGIPSDSVNQYWQPTTIFTFVKN